MLGDLPLTLSIREDVLDGAFKSNRRFGPTVTRLPGGWQDYVQAIGTAARATDAYRMRAPFDAFDPTTCRQDRRTTARID